MTCSPRVRQVSVEQIARGAHACQLCPAGQTRTPALQVLSGGTQVPNVPPIRWMVPCRGCSMSYAIGAHARAPRSMPRTKRRGVRHAAAMASAAETVPAASALTRGTRRRQAQFLVLFLDRFSRHHLGARLRIGNLRQPRLVCFPGRTDLPAPCPPPLAAATDELQSLVFHRRSESRERTKGARQRG